MKLFWLLICDLLIDKTALSKFHCSQLPNDVFETRSFAWLTVPAATHQLGVTLRGLFGNRRSEIVVEHLDTDLESGKV